MLINTKHIVMFDDAANDFGRIARMVDDDGAVLVIKDGRPAYAVVSFDDVQEADRPATGSTPKVEPVAEPTCPCGKPQSQCGCGGHGGGGGCGGHGGHGGHKHGGGGHGGHGDSGHAHARTVPHFGHGSDAGHLHSVGGDGIWFNSAPADDNGDWEVNFEAGPGFDPLFHGGPGFSVDDFIGKMPPEMVEAGKRFVSQLSPLIGLFGGAMPSPTEDSDKDN